MINVLVVDDSPVVREFLCYVLEADPEIRVVGLASNGKEAISFIQSRKPDVITMDIVMPEMDGFAATRAIMETVPVPIVIVSGGSMSEVTKTFHAVEAGAVAIVEKPAGTGSPGGDEAAEKLRQTVKAMAEVRVVRRWPRRPRTAPAGATSPPLGVESVARDIALVAVGASTGGPPGLQSLLTGLTPSFPVPVVIVQHMAPGFLPGLTAWLTQSTGLPTRIAANGDVLLPGQAYVAPDDFHLGVSRGGRLTLKAEKPEDGMRPAVSYLFRSVARAFGARAAGVLLSGMGKDGAHELLSMRQQGAVTMVQDRESSTVFGMPRAAIELGAASYVLPPQQIAATLRRLVERNTGKLR